MILCLLTWEIFQWAMIHIIVLCAIHMIGKRNVLADKMFRGRSVIRHTELLYESVYCKTHIQTFDPSNIDLFPTWENRNFRYVILLFRWRERLQPMHWMQTEQGWMHMHSPDQFCFTWFSTKLSREPCNLILIVPFAPRHSWYPSVTELLMDHPRKIIGWLYRVLRCIGNISTIYERSVQRTIKKGRQEYRHKNSIENNGQEVRLPP